MLVLVQTARHPQALGVFGAHVREPLKAGVLPATKAAYFSVKIDDT